MKASPPLKRLGDVCAFDKTQGLHRDLPYVGLEHIESHTAQFIGSSDPLTVKSSTFKFTSEHVLYGRLRPYLNKVFAPDFVGHCSTEIFPIKPTSELSREYLVYWFLSDATVERINETCTGARMPRADMNEVLSFSLPVPSLQEQNRIVAILDEAFDGIATARANAEQNLQNARALFESHLQSFFSQGGDGWLERRLGDIFYIGSSKRVYENEWTPSGVPFYGGREIVKLAMGVSPVVSAAHISEEKYCELTSQYDMPQEGNILMTARGTIGVGYVVRDGDRFYYKDGNIISFREKTPTNPWFILFAFRTKLILDQIGDLTGATVKHLPIEKANALTIKIPGLAAQNSLVEKMRAVEGESQRLESIYQRKLAALDELKKSLLHQAFSGEL